MADVPIMPLYVTDYLADTLGLSLEEHGAYTRLLWNATFEAEIQAELKRLCPQEQ